MHPPYNTPRSLFTLLHRWECSATELPKEGEDRETEREKDLKRDNLSYKTNSLIIP